MNKPIYLDYMATTPVDPRVAEKMLHYLTMEGIFGNPASATHTYGQDAARAVETARQQIADVIQADRDDIIFTSGATEANNLALFGAANFYQCKGKHLITMSTEHKSVLDCCKQLEKEGFSVTYLPPQPDGLLDLAALEKAITPQTILVSVMHVNNEIGVIQPLEAIADLIKHQGIIFHVDAAQSVGKIPVDVQKLNVDLMSLSAHKNYGPKGIGALYVRQKPRIRIQAQTFGGGHERGLRSGTLATHQIIGMAEAFTLGESLREQEQAKLASWRQQVWQSIQHLPGIHLNGHAKQRVAGNLNISFSGIQSDRLLTALSDLAVSTSSACVSASTHPSYVLNALGLSDELAYSSIRLSLGRFTREEEIALIAGIINRAVTGICLK